MHCLMLICKLKGLIPCEHLTLNLPLGELYLIATLCLSCPLLFIHGPSYRFLIYQDLIVDVSLLHDDIDALLAREEGTCRRMMDLRVIL